VVGGAALLVITALVSNRARWILIAIMGRLLDVDIEAVFSSKNVCEPDLHKELARAREVAILTGRGNELQREAFYPIFLKRPAAKQLRIRILLPRTDPGPEYDWTQQREEELATFDHAFTQHGLLKDQIAATVRFLDPYIVGGQVELRRFACPHIGRVILTDRCAFFTPYREDSHGRDCSVFKYRHGEIYDNFSRLFEQLWLGSAPVAQHTAPRVLAARLVSEPAILLGPAKDDQ
jgi:hypothetical protein